MTVTQSEAFVKIAPRSVPRVSAYDYPHRSPVLVVTTGSTFFHVDLDELTDEEAQAFVTRMRSALEVYAEQLTEWQKRAAMDRTGPYVIPPVQYGIPGDVHGEVRVPGDGGRGDEGPVDRTAADAGAGDAG